MGEGWGHDHHMRHSRSVGACLCVQEQPALLDPGGLEKRDDCEDFEDFKTGFSMRTPWHLLLAPNNTYITLACDQYHAWFGVPLLGSSNGQREWLEMAAAAI